MSWFSFLFRSFGTLSGWQWALLAAIPPAIFLLYFLKLRRRPLEVPSTYLWHRTLEDLHVNSLWQRLRQSLLLFLQLLFALLLLLACINPSWEAQRLTEKRLIFLIDNSASMGATDEGSTRLEKAKQFARQVIEEMKTGEVGMLVSFSDRAQIEQPFTDDRRQLLRQLEAIQPTHRASDLQEALRVASGLANPGHTAEDPTDMPAPEAQPAVLFIYSDGGFRNVPEVALGNLKPRYVSVGKAECQNLGIVAFEATRPGGPSSPLEVFGRIQNFSASDHEITASLYSGDELLDAKQLMLPAASTGGVSFRVAGFDAGVLRLQLEIEDDLELDNVAYAVVNPPRRSRVLVVSPGNEPLDIALATEYLGQLAILEKATPQVLTESSYQDAAALGTYDLIIYDRCRPDTPPRASTLYLGSLPKVEGWSSEPCTQPPLIIDTARTHPLMQYVQMGRVLIERAETLRGPAGSRVMIDADQGPLAVLAPREGYEDLVLGFPLLREDEQGATVTNTDWPIHISFPLFMSNVFRYLGGAIQSQQQGWVRPGQPMRLRWPTAIEAVTVTTPEGQSLKASPGVENAFLFGATETVGVYVARPDSEAELSEQRFAVNLFDAVESDIVPKEIIRTQYEEIAAQPQWEPVRRELWRYVLLVGLAVILFEWYVYNRRVYL